MPLVGVLGDGPSGAVVAESQGDQAAQVQRCGAVVQPVIVAADTTVADLAVAAAEPGDGAFDHRSILTVLVEPLRVSRFSASRSLKLIMKAEPDAATVAAGGALGAQCAATARHPENSVAGRGDRAGHVGRAGDSLGAAINDEIVDGETTGDRRTQRCRFDSIEMPSLGQVSTEFTAAVGRIAQYRHRLIFIGEKLRGHR